MAIIVGTNGDDVLQGTGGDQVFGLDGNDRLIGKGGSNILVGGAGADEIQGNGYTDYASYTGSSAGVTIDLAAHTASGGDAQGDVLSGINGLIGSAFGDVLSANLGGFYRLEGGAGDDVLTLGFGGGSIEGGAGADTLIGATNAPQWLTAVYYGHSSAGVTVNLASGTGSGGDAEGDVLQNITAVSASAYDDVLIGGEANDYFLAGSGNDVLRGGAGGDELYGGDGEDTADYSQAATGVAIALDGSVVRLGEAQGDNLQQIEDLLGSAFNDTLAGNGLANVLEGGAGADALDGRGGNDTLSYEHSAAGVTVSLTTGVALGGDAEGDTLARFVNLLGSAFADTLAGDAGNNVLEGGAGADTLYGSGGTDTATYARSAAGVQVDVAVGTGTGGDAAGDSLFSVENLIGSAYNDILASGFGANTLSGGAGDDILRGGAGADILNGGDGSDRVFYNSSQQGVTVNLLLGVAVGGDAEDDSLISIEGVTGSDFADRLTGNAAGNTLYGRGGADILSGGAGADILSGDAGADQLDGGSGIDTAYYAGSAAGVQIDLGAHTAAGGEAAGDTLTGIEQLIGSEFADTLTGDAGANGLRGQGGDDVLTGGGGGDTLRGGAGSDRFVYLAASDSAGGLAIQDAIGDFTAGDKVDVSGIDANGAGPGDGSFTFITGAFTGAGGELRVAAGLNGYVAVQGDIDGDTVADFTINVLSDHALTAADFVL
jgi:Ca2+-binding RTX toxin-like protein